jgi:hypothetical protein
LTGQLRWWIAKCLVIGGMAGGGKGAAIRAGGGAVPMTRGRPAKLPPETRVTFRLKTPVR